MQLQGARVVVIGGSSGIGLATAQQARQAGADVTIVGRSPDRLVQAQQVLGAFLTSGALGHHGWGWATDEPFELTGKLTNVRLGHPHGEVTLTVDGEIWQAALSPGAAPNGRLPRLTLEPDGLGLTVPRSHDALTSQCHGGSPTEDQSRAPGITIPDRR
jgi:hypothetical protein